MNISAFLTYYEQAHRNRANRYVHHVAHFMALVGVLGFFWVPLLGLALIACGFVFSWAGHFVFERNTPAFFEAAPTGGLSASLLQKVKVAIGGLAWSGACFLRLFGIGPLVKG